VTDCYVMVQGNTVSGRLEIRMELAIRPNLPC